MDITHRTYERIRIFAGGVFFSSLFLFLGAACLCVADDQVFLNPDTAHSNPSRDVWLFNTRPLSRTCPDNEPLDKIVVHRLDDKADQLQRRWERSELDEFFQTLDSDIPTIIFIHGNYNSLAESLERATTFEDYVLREANSQQGQKYRLLIWAWPSDDPVGWYLRDSKIKTFYSHQQGEYVAEILCRFPHESRVCLVGYCFGAITVCETLERLLQKTYTFNEAERQTGSSCEPQEAKLPKLPLTVRNLLFVPAIDPCTILPRHIYGNAIPICEKTIVLYNPRDFVLFWYPLTYGLKGRQPIGRQGIPWCCLPQETRSKIEGINISPFSGSVHKFPVYFSNRSLNQKLTRFVCFESLDADICQ